MERKGGIGVSVRGVKAYHSLCVTLIDVGHVGVGTKGGARSPDKLARDGAGIQATVILKSHGVVRESEMIHDELSALIVIAGSEKEVDL